MKVYRITSIAGCIRYWDFIRRGIEETAKFLRYDLDIETYRQMIFHLAKQPNAWFGIVLDSNGTPLSFGIAHECTPLFAKQREFEASFIYHNPGHAQATSILLAAFEDFCREEKITKVYATTRRDSGSSIRCYQSARFGFKRAYTTFVKEI